LDCPIPAVRAVVLASNVPGLQPSHDLDPDLVTELNAIYHDTDFPSRSKSWASRDLTPQRVLLGWMHRYANAEHGVRLDELKAITGIDEPRLYSMLAQDPSSYSSTRAGDHVLLEPTRPWPKRQPLAEGRRVRLPKCPHCDLPTLLQPLRVPELPDGVLCTTCRRAPSTRFVYPPEYLQPWVGPLQGNRTTRTNDSRDPVGTLRKDFRIPPRTRAA
jgi:hypothetical protein